MEHNPGSWVHVWWDFKHIVHDLSTLVSVRLKAKWDNLDLKYPTTLQHFTVQNEAAAKRLESREKKKWKNDRINYKEVNRWIKCCMKVADNGMLLITYTQLNMVLTYLIYYLRTYMDSSKRSIQKNIYKRNKAKLKMHCTPFSIQHECRAIVSMHFSLHNL